MRISDYLEPVLPPFADEVSSILRHGGIEPHIADVVEDVQAALAHNAGGRGISVVPVSVAALNWPGIAFIPLTESSAVTPVSCVHVRNDQSAVLARLLSRSWIACLMTSPSLRRRPSRSPLACTRRIERQVSDGGWLSGRSNPAGARQHATSRFAHRGESSCTGRKDCAFTVDDAVLECRWSFSDRERNHVCTDKSMLNHDRRHDS